MFKKTLFRWLSLLLGVLWMFYTGEQSVHARDGFEELEGEIVQIAVPDHTGKLIYYTGDAAKNMYAEIEKNSIDSVDALQEALKALPPKGKSFVELASPGAVRGPFHYRYRFVKESSGTIFGPTRRITQILENRTSSVQQMQVGAEASTSWSINASLGAGFMDAFTSAMGESWQNTSSILQEFTMNVKPGKKTWLEFKARLRYVSGKAQKYFIPRGPVKQKPVVVESKDVYSTSPTTVTLMLSGQSMQATDGVYVWKETNIK